MAIRAIVLRRAGISALVIAVLAVLLMVAIILLRAPVSPHDPPTIASCIDPIGAACDSEENVIEYIERELSNALPADTELLHTRSNTSSLRSSAFGYAVLSMSAAEAQATVAGLEKRSPEDFGSRSETIAEFGAKEAEDTYQDGEATISLMATTNPGQRILVVSIQFYY